MMPAHYFCKSPVLIAFLALSMPPFAVLNIIIDISLTYFRCLS